MRKTKVTLFVAILIFLLFCGLIPSDPTYAFHFPWDQGHDTFEPEPPDDPPPDDNDKCNSKGSPFVVGTGAYTVSIRDVFVPGRIDLEVMRTYSSLDLHNGMFGRGWTYTYGVRAIKVTNGITTAVIIRRENGQRDRYFFETNGTYRSPPDVFETLVENEDGSFELTDIDFTTMRFDASGALTTILDRNSNLVSLDYDNDGFLVRVTEDSGRALQFFKGPNGKVSRIVNPAGHAVEYAYDAEGNLIGVTVPGGGTIAYAYDSKGRLISITDPRGNLATSLTYDTTGRLSTYTDNDERYTLTYNPENRQVIERDTKGNQRILSYNENINITGIIDRIPGIQESIIYGSTFNPVTIVDRNGNRCQYGWNEKGDVVSLTDAVGEVTAVTYDPRANKPLTITDPRGNTTTYAYTDSGNLALVEDALSNRTVMAYDNRGQLVTSSDPLGNVTTHTYDIAGNLIEVQGPDGNTVKMSYDAVGNVTSTKDVLGRSTIFSYDANNRIKLLSDPLGNSSSFAYDESGNLTAFTTRNGHTTAFAYDTLNRHVRTTTPLGYEETFSYDNFGNVASRTDANGNKIVYLYDALHRLIRKETVDNTIIYSYDGYGNLLSLEDDDTHVIFTYNNLNRVVRTQTIAAGAQPATILEYTYDENGNRATFTDSEGGVTTYEYDAINRLLRQQNSAGDVTTWSYDARSRPVERRQGNGAVTSSWDSVGQLIRKETSFNAQSVLDETITYDAVGNRVEILDADGAHRYTYDAANQLISVKRPLGTSDDEVYTYDAAGNRTNSHLSANYRYDANRRLLEDDTFIYTYDPVGNLTKKTRKENGATTIYTYDAENQLVRIDRSDGGFSTYRYDGLSRRVAKNVDGQVTRYVYDGWHIVEEYGSSDDIPTARYTYGVETDAVLSVHRGGQSFFYHADSRGSIRAITDTAGTVVNRYAYDSFGRIAGKFETIDNAFMFTGREFDDESELYYYRTRMYKPAIGRFLTIQVHRQPDGFLYSRDPITPRSQAVVEDFDIDPAIADRVFQSELSGPLVSLSTILYVYGHNNPVSVTDPTGENAAIVRALIVAGKIAAKYAKKMAKFCKKVRCKVEIHGPHHYFGWPYNKKMRHVQLTCWIKGKKRSDTIWRIPIPDW